MPKKNPVLVTEESPTGRNLQFKNENTGKNMSRSEFVKAIEKGCYPDYHIRNINHIKTPVSNPDKSKNNNLG